ncbi:MAG TPA: hypothetical protein VMH77_08335 [Steroidobacteraceae bacterium]|nr:hypothetical protein [Steroidobacteraceae bacterium]
MRAMKMLAIMLTGMSLGLAASSWYLWQALSLERAHNLQVVQSRRPAPPAAVATAVLAPVKVAAPAPVPARPPQDAPARETGKMAAVRQQLDSLQDPGKRAARIADIRAGLQQGMQDGIAYAGITPDEAQRLLDSMARTAVDSMERAAQCRLTTPDCDVHVATAPTATSFRIETEGWLGREKMLRLDTFGELARIRNFSGQLPADQALTEAAANELARAMAEERDRDAPADESSAAFEQRLHDRAARMLTPEQLAAFQQREQLFKP